MAPKESASDSGPPYEIKYSTPWPTEERACWLVTLTLRLIEGRLEPIAVHMEPHPDQDPHEPRPLTSTAIRLPLGELVEKARKSNAETLQRIQTKSWIPEYYEPPAALRAILDASVTSGGQAQQDTYEAIRQAVDDRLSKVAQVYLDALLHTGKPTLAVMNSPQWETKISYSLASKWVRECRKRGLLPPTAKGRARGFDRTAQSPSPEES